MHSIMVIRHGKIVAEGYWKPFDKAFRHRMYSVSKSFVAGAVGLLLDKGKIKLSDRICTYFPEYPEEEMHPYIRETTIRNLLMMATPFEDSYALRGEGRNAKHWVESFFTETPDKPAGTMHYKNARGEKSLTFGYGEYKEGVFPETHYSGDYMSVPIGRGYRYVGAGVWPEENHLLLRINIIDEYIGNLTLAFGFRDNKIGFRASKAAEAFLDDYEGLAGGEA